MNIDLTTLSDDEFDQLRVDVLTEKERRDSLAQIPAQVTALAKTYRAGGGDANTLMDAVRTTTPEDV